MFRISQQNLADQTRAGSQISVGRDQVENVSQQEVGNEKGRSRGVEGGQVGQRPVGEETSQGDVGNDCVQENN